MRLEPIAIGLFTGVAEWIDQRDDGVRRSNQSIGGRFDFIR